MDFSQITDTKHKFSVRAFTMLLIFFVLYSSIYSGIFSSFNSNSFGTFKSLVYTSISIDETVQLISDDFTMEPMSATLTGINGSTINCTSILKLSTVDGNLYKFPVAFWFFVNVDDYIGSVSEQLITFALATGFNHFEGHPEMYNRDVTDDPDAYCFIF